MNRNFIIALFFTVLSVLVTACGKNDPEMEDNSSILLYVAGNNSLSPYAYDMISQLMSGELPAKYSGKNIILLYSHTPGHKPILSKITRRYDGTGVDSTILCVYDSLTNSATVEQFRKVVTDAQTLCPAEHRGLVLWSHATGYLPEGYTASPDKRNLKKAFGNDYRDESREIEIQDLVAALPTTYDYILFDCCLMGTVEVAYEFKDVAKYLLFSPTEIMSQGFPYYMMMEQIFGNSNLEEALTNVAKEYYNYYLELYEKTKSYYAPTGGTITLVRTSAMENLAAVCKTIYANHRDEILNLDESGVQGYFRSYWKWFYDLGDIVEQVSDENEYDTFKKAMNDVIVYKAATPKFLSITINKYSGLSTYLPREDYTKMNTYYKTLQWNIATEAVK